MFKFIIGLVFLLVLCSKFASKKRLTIVSSEGASLFAATLLVLANGIFYAMLVMGIFAISYNIWEIFIGG